jgi:GNAT superfamily N-acetyltransferase
MPTGRDGASVTLAARTRWTLERYWADRLGVSTEALVSAGTSTGHADEGGVQVFRRDEALVVAAPPALADVVAGRLDGLVDAREARRDGWTASADWRSRASADDDPVGEWLDGIGRVVDVLGPTFYGYVDRETFTPAASAARVLTAGDEAAFGALRRAVSDAEWDAGGPAFTPGETVGLFVGDDLVAVSGRTVWDDLLAHLSVVVHPDHRGAGHGRAVVSLATERALADGLVPQYRTADAWPWSVALAESLGYERFATAWLGVTAGSE